MEIMLNLVQSLKPRILEMKRLQEEKKKTLDTTFTQLGRQFTKDKPLRKATETMKKWFSSNIQNNFKTAAQQKKYIKERISKDQEMKQSMEAAEKLLKEFPVNLDSKPDNGNTYLGKKKERFF